MEDNLGVRAATAVAKMVQKGRVVGLGASQSVLWCYGKALESLEGRGWGFWTEWDENSLNPSLLLQLMHVFCSLMPLVT